MILNNANNDGITNSTHNNFFFVLLIVLGMIKGKDASYWQRQCLLVRYISRSTHQPIRRLGFDNSRIRTRSIDITFIFMVGSLWLENDTGEFQNSKNH